MTVSTLESSLDTPGRSGRSALQTVLKAVVSAALLIWILHDINLSDIFASLRAASMSIFALALSLCLIGFYVSVHRWLVLLRAQGMNASIPFLLQSFTVSLFFNNLLPSTVGGDAVRIYDSWKAGLDKTRSVAVIFVDRFLGLVALMLCALVALLLSTPFVSRLPSLYVWVPLITTGMLLGVWLMFMPPQRLYDWVLGRKQRCPRKLHAILDKVITALTAFRGKTPALTKALGLSLLLQVAFVIQYYLVAEALAVSMPFYSYFFTIPLATIVMLIPVSINGIGIREMTFVYFFSTFGVEKADAIAIAWLSYAILLIMGVLGGIVYAFRR